MDSGSIDEIILNVFMGLYSSGGTEREEKFGNIPLKKHRVAFAWSVKSNTTVRLLICVVTNSETNGMLQLIPTSEIQSRLKKVLSSLKEDTLNLGNLERDTAQLSSLLTVTDEISRLSKVFGEEI